MGVQESIIPAAVAPMVSADRRASAYGLFTGAYGTAWVAGSIVIGLLFGVSLGAVTAFSRRGAARRGAVPRRPCAGCGDCRAAGLIMRQDATPR